ncbi:hypothetical protein [Streptacidiphilus rugosus]|uniref:hypothetical protein n=1 Tax=Streptacidiphilus rugosus TaxID=405783 RepID=UPI0005695429|nr:hypothetical protein [Streptacidiphilus rugosus]
MSRTTAFQQGDLVRIYRDSALAAMETATVVRMHADGGVRLRFHTDGHEATCRHGLIEPADTSHAPHYLA